MASLEKCNQILKTIGIIHMIPVEPVSRRTWHWAQCSPSLAAYNDDNSSGVSRNFRAKSYKSGGGEEHWSHAHADTLCLGVFKAIVMCSQPIATENLWQGLPPCIPCNGPFKLCQPMPSPGFHHISAFLAFMILNRPPSAIIHFLNIYTWTFVCVLSNLAVA